MNNIELREQVLAMIQAINNVGYRILVIDDRFYKVDSFEPAEKGIEFHYIKGIDITILLMKMINLANIKVAIATYEQELERMSLIKHQYSKDYKYILYLS